ncbi:MAG TPA: hypothetical protein PK775_08260 [Rectinema sp.]|nr:hypothetical protein [Rectinema sp.]HNT59470.1 hypothetical protein [Rectinema sp.]HOD58988.1 hypothetical protein [Rectinema sp.]HOE99733.1 hypothetical protein [Rectinema sp.]HOM93344.1 hypothetical protein [Rectinema sp.]
MQKLFPTSSISCKGVDIFRAILSEAASSSWDSDRYTLLLSMTKKKNASAQRKSESKTFGALELLFFGLLIGLIIQWEKHIMRKTFMPWAEINPKQIPSFSITELLEKCFLGNLYKVLAKRS